MVQSKKPRQSGRSIEDLLEQIRDGAIDEQEGYAILFKEVTPFIIGMIKRVAPNSTEDQITDIAAIVWSEIWRNIELYDPDQKASFTTWASTITRNRTIDAIRRLQATPDMESLEEAGPASSIPQTERVRAPNQRLPLEDLVAKELQSAAMTVLLELPAFDRTLYLLYLNYDISHNELAEIASKARGKEMSVKAVQSRIYRIRDDLFAKLREQGILDAE